MTTPAPDTGSFPNRAHYLKAALAGGGVGTLLSLIPIVNMLNLVFGLLIMCGGAFAVWMVQKKTQSVQLLEATVIGALAGLVTGLIVFVFVSMIGVPMFGLRLANAPDRMADDILLMATMMLGGTCCISVTVYPVIAAVGGLVGGLIFKPDPSAIGLTDPEGRPLPPREPTPEELAKTAKLKRIAIAGCIGCLGLSLLGCGVSGYLFYLETRDPEDTAGQEAVVEAPVTGALQTFVIPAAGEGSKSYAIWLVGNDELPIGLDITGRGECRLDYGGGGEPPTYLSSTYTYRGRDEGHPEWIMLDTHYAYSDMPSNCHYQITTNPPVPGARIVVTALSHPSDMLD